MSDENNNEKEVSNQSNNILVLDGILQDFVYSLNRAPKGKIPITLLVNGFLVSGDMISGKQFFLDTAASPIVGEGSLKEYFMNIAETEYAFEDDSEKGADPVFIHLTNTRFFIPGAKGIPGNMGVSWRGKIADISGYFFGTLNTDE